MPNYVHASIHVCGIGLFEHSSIAIQQFATCTCISGQLRRIRHHLYLQQKRHKRNYQYHKNSAQNTQQLICQSSLLLCSIVKAWAGFGVGPWAQEYWGP